MKNIVDGKILFLGSLCSAHDLIKDTVAFDFSKPVEGTITLYAKWIEEVPETGDSSNIALWITAFIGSMSAVAVTFFKRKKKA